MPIAYPSQNQPEQVFLSEEETASLFYHNIFEYPLTMAELIKWAAGGKVISDKLQVTSIGFRNGFYYLGNSGGIVLKRLMRKRISARKLEIAKNGAGIISLIPTVKMVAVTGALAMENASDEADIDLMIVTKKGTLWTTRAFTYLLIYLFGIKFRRPGDARQRDKLCLNMWLDEADLTWGSKRRNIYTAHEIAQIRPIVNKNKTYEKFIWENRWIKQYWPNAVGGRNQELGIRNKSGETLIHNSPAEPAKLRLSFIIRPLEWLAFKLQYLYMRSKITREVILPTRALFHPVDWGKYVLSKLEG